MNPWVSAAESVRAITRCSWGSTGNCPSAASSTSTMISRSVRPCVASPELGGERFAGRVQIGQERMEPEPALVGRGCPLLLGMRGDERAVEVDHIEPRVRARLPRLRASRRARLGDPDQRVLIDGFERAPRGRQRRDFAEQTRLVTQHRQIGDRFAAAGEHHRQIDQHLATIVTPTALLGRRHRRRQGLGQPKSVGKIAQHTRPRVGHHLLAVTVTTSRGRVELRCISEVPSWVGNCSFDKCSFPNQEGVFADATRRSPVRY